MKKKRTIIIKNPKLRKIRDNFRSLWIEWGQKMWFELNEEYKEIHYDKNKRPRHPNDYSNEERQLVGHIKSKMREIDNYVDNSICKCIVCGKGDRDMTYNPIDKEWYCTKCYQENKEFYKDTKESFLYP